MPSRRLLLLSSMALPAGGLAGLRASAAQAAADAPPVVRPRPLHLPEDFGAHPEFRTEWWYVTGWLTVPVTVEPFGFQVTFFRTRTGVAASASRFAARQIVSAHLALTDPVAQRLRHDQRVARTGFGIAEATPGDTDLRLRGWTLARQADAALPAGHRYRARLDAAAQGFGLDLDFAATQPVLLQGAAGYSRKGPDPAQASYYLSEPQLAVSGSLRLDGKLLAVSDGRAWLDHEWSEALLHPEAVGWDWIGMNLDDGAALTAFRLRRADGSALWAGGSYRAADGRTTQVFADPGALRFTPLRVWKSPATQAGYPLDWRIDTPAGRFEVRARLDAQELDSRASTGAVYWEGLSDLVRRRRPARRPRLPRAHRLRGGAEAGLTVEACAAAAPDAEADEGADAGAAACAA